MADSFVPVRLSHLLRDCSVGAIVRGSDSLMVVQDIRTWDRPGSDPLDREIRYVERVRSALGIQQKLCEPPRSVEVNGFTINWIPALRFPLWSRCRDCGLLYRAPWRKRGIGADDVDSPHTEPAESASGGETEKCDDCGGKLDQVPWVLVHEQGYLADVPWHDLTHSAAGNREQRGCSSDPARPHLKLVDTEEGRRLTCRNCGAGGVFAAGALPRVPFRETTWQQPWIPEPPDRPPPADALAWIMPIHDVRTHSAVTATALVIPPESRVRHNTVVDRLYGSATQLKRVRDVRSSSRWRRTIRQLAREYRCGTEAIEEALREIDSGYPLYGRTVTGENLLANEFDALREEIPDLGDEEDFVTKHHTREWKKLGRTLPQGVALRAALIVSQLVAVHKLKEILVLRGFRRAGGEIVPPDITGESHWLPALKLYGEGIFFTLDESLLRRWENDAMLAERAEAFVNRYEQPVGDDTPDRNIEVSPRFMLCHTLAHLLIRKIEAEAGYPAASLKERIYCSTEQGASRKPMAGILIYVAVPDEQGSLGGLMELAKPERFVRLLAGAVESASWCSLDPVCAEQEGHGPSLLNRAACHACALLPETSCAHGNVLLDRVFVTGKASEIPSILDLTGEP